MKTKVPATIEDLYSVPGKAELVNGEIVLMSPTGDIPGYAADEIYASLRDYARQTKRGHALADNKAFIVDLPNRKSFSPDAAFHMDKLNVGFHQGPPLFAVEVRSEHDYGPAAERRIANKIKDYFDAGTQVVWDVDVLRERVIRVYRATNPGEPVIYREGEMAEAETAVPGWRILVDDILYEEAGETEE